MTHSPALHVITYHYVRDLPNTKFPRIRGLLTDKFREQVDWLASRYEMSRWESALGFLRGEYVPAGDLCVLTFDDGLREHAEVVTPILAERNIQGLFFLTTAALEEHRVLQVHKSHFLMAALGFERYRHRFLRRLEELVPEADITMDPAAASRFYRFDEAEVAQFKYFLGTQLAATTRQRIVDSLFAECLGPEAEFSQELYLSWDEAREMQESGMILGGHSHRHAMLATLSDAAQWEDLSTCAQLLRARLRSQDDWPFCYPYGSPNDSYNHTSIQALRELGFSCAFTTVEGSNAPAADLFQIRRIDTVDLPV